ERLAGPGRRPPGGRGGPDPDHCPRSGPGPGDLRERVLAPCSATGPKRGLTPVEEWALIAECRTRFPGLPLERACALLEINRGSFYRTVSNAVPGSAAPVREPAALALRAAIETVVLAF